VWELFLFLFSLLRQQQEEKQRRKQNLRWSLFQRKKEVSRITRKGRLIQKQILDYIDTTVYPVSTRQLALELKYSWNTVQRHCLELLSKHRIERFELPGSHLWIPIGKYGKKVSAISSTESNTSIRENSNTTLSTERGTSLSREKESSQVVAINEGDNAKENEPDYRLRKARANLNIRNDIDAHKDIEIDIDVDIYKIQQKLLREIEKQIETTVSAIIERDTAWRREIHIDEKIDRKLKANRKDRTNSEGDAT
jgi:hypothetical protein